tara:strand:- start:161 stop:361 length:201 start_codon:yes stop_codon:yes gene_type:complete
MKKKSINKNLLPHLVCPISRSKLIYDPVRNELISKAAAVAFPVRNGIPILVIDEARKIESNITSSD